MSVEFTAYKFKDEAPLQTINKVRLFLASKNILATESWNNIGNTSYSVHLSIPSTQITANGKGISKDLALASAYGELAERLSLLLPFRVSPFYSMFYETIISKYSRNFHLFLRNDFNQWLSSADADCFFEQLSCYHSKEELMEFWRKRFNDSSEFKVASSFSEIKLNQEQEDTTANLTIPLPIVDYYYGSNGMCAGNTFEEALVQGIAEIIERYVQKKIILGKDVKCYDITQAYLSNTKEMENTILELADRHFSLTILECISELPIPVICAILKKTNGEYYVSFGCHPCVNVGVERAITELLQGYNLQTLDSAFSDQYLIQNSMTYVQENYMNLIKFGKGAYPIEFIYEKHHTKDIAISAEVQSNKQLLQKLCNILQKNGYKIYLCKGIEIGLFCYHVVIPGLSEVQDLFPPTKIRNDSTMAPYGRLNELTINEAYRLAELCAVRWENGEKYLEQLISVDKYREYCNCHITTEGINSSLFISLLYIKAKNWSHAVEYINKFCEELISDMHVEAEEIAYYRMVRSILEMLDAGWNKEKICKVINADTETYTLVNAICTGENLFDNIPDLSPEGLLRDSESLELAVKTESDLLCQLLV